MQMFHISCGIQEMLNQLVTLRSSPSGDTLVFSQHYLVYSGYLQSVREDETLSLEAKSEASEMELLKKQFEQLQAEMKQLKLQQPSSGKAKPNQTKGIKLTE